MTLFDCFNTTNNDLTSPQLQEDILLGNLVESAPETNQLDTELPNGQLPLHFALREGKEDAVVHLLKLGANPLAKDRQGLTAIDYAIIEEHTDLLPLLFGKKATDDFVAAVNQQGSYWVSSAYSCRQVTELYAYSWR